MLTMPIFRVMCFEAGMWDRDEARKIEAEDEQQAAEMVCGERLAEGPVKLEQLRAQVWPVSSPGGRTAFGVQPRNGLPGFVVTQDPSPRTPR
jgi:hypothetical protein